MSVAISIGRGLRIKPPPAFSAPSRSRVLGVPLLALIALAVAFAVMDVVLERTVFGRSVTAIGQNQRAARLAGVKVERARLVAYVMCAVLAGDRRRAARLLLRRRFARTWARSTC